MRWSPAGACAPRPVLPLIGSAGKLIVSNSDRPLQIAASLSALMSLIDFLFIFHVIFIRIFRADVEPGWASTNLFTAVMFPFYFSCSRLVCQYLAEIRSEIKSRPLYVVQAELQSNVMPRRRKARNVVTHEERAESNGCKCPLRSDAALAGK